MNINQPPFFITDQKKFVKEITNVFDHCFASCGCKARNFAAVCDTLIVACPACFGNVLHPAEKRIK